MKVIYMEIAHNTDDTERFKLIGRRAGIQNSGIQSFHSRSIDLGLETQMYFFYFTQTHSYGCWCSVPKQTHRETYRARDTESDTPTHRDRVRKRERICIASVFEAIQIASDCLWLVFTDPPCWFDSPQEEDIKLTGCIDLLRGCRCFFVCLRLPYALLFVSVLDQMTQNPLVWS